MSYCRWSSLNWMCDVYCYEDVAGGWTTHVAGRRRTREPDPPMPDFVEGAADEWVKQYKAHHKDLDTIDIADIGLPYDGESFNNPTLEEFRDTLLMLREAGYIVPDYVFDEIVAEIAEGAASPTDTTENEDG